MLGLPERGGQRPCGAYQNEAHSNRKLGTPRRWLLVAITTALQTLGARSLASSREPERPLGRQSRLSSGLRFCGSVISPQRKRGRSCCFWPRGIRSGSRPTGWCGPPRARWFVNVEVSRPSSGGSVGALLGALPELDRPVGFDHADAVEGRRWRVGRLQAPRRGANGRSAVLDRRPMTRPRRAAYDDCWWARFLIVLLVHGTTRRIESDSSHAEACECDRDLWAGRLA